MELKEQLEVEEEDGDRQEEEVEVEREKRVKESAPWKCECAQNLSHEVCGVITNCGRCAVRADSVHVRNASVEVQAHCVNVVIGVLVVHGELLVGVRVVPVFVCDAVVDLTLRSHSCYTVAIVFM